MALRLAPGHSWSTSVLRSNDDQTILPGLRASHLIEVEELADLLTGGDPNLRIIDMRGYVKAVTTPDGRQEAVYTGAEDDYLAAHIPGAVYLDWTTDIVDLNDLVPVQVAGEEKIARTLGERGISDVSHVVVYDNHPAAQFATRLWWVMRYYGHGSVRVLNGGWNAWIRAKKPTTATVAPYPPAIFTPQIDPPSRATAEEVISLIGAADSVILDARDEGQYSGKVRRGPRAGRIPSARWLPREALVGEDGRFRSEDEIVAIAEKIIPDEDSRIVAYCNGGVAATSVLFALSSVGYQRLTNYDGSWNEWSLRTDLPVDAGEPNVEGRPPCDP